MAVRFVSIVEGKGELQAVPVLIRRILAEINVHDATILDPVRVRRDKQLKESDNELLRALSFAIAKLGNNVGTILILIDSEGDCAVEMSLGLRDRARAVRSDLPIHVVIAHPKYETWFLAGANTFAGQRGLLDDLSDHPSPERVQGAKQWLTDHMAGSRAYSETTDQAAFSATFVMVAARRNCTSFDKFYRTVCAITAAQGPLP